MTAPAEPGFLDRLRARFGWLDRTLRAQDRYQKCKGDFFAAGITYFTVFAIFPLAMVAFAAAGFVLANDPGLLQQAEERIRTSVSGDLGDQLIGLMDSAIKSRTSVGVIGLATAVWAGLGWMANLREALSEMWLQRSEPGAFLATKLSDLLALISTFAALAATIALTAISNSGLLRRIQELLGLQDVTGAGVALYVASLVLSLGVSWLLFTWVIARLPRESVSLHSSMRAGLLAAVAFEIFKQVATIYLSSVTNGPAGATFGPVLGLMVFAYVTARLILFATAWAATSADSLASAPVDPPEAPAVITTRVQVREGLSPGAAVTAVAAGALGALGLSRWVRRR